MGKGSRPHRTTGQKRPKARRPLGAALPSSRAGRPRLAGERYANGRLKPVGPNAVVLARRRALLGDPAARGKALAAAENALDLMLARGWLSKDEHQAAQAYGQLHRRAQMGLPGMKTSNPERVGEGRGMGGPGPVDPAALLRLSQIWKSLAARPAARGLLVELCVLKAWPAFVIEAVAGDPKAMSGRARKDLAAALTVVQAVLSRPAPRGVLAQAKEVAAFVDWLRGPAG